MATISHQSIDPPGDVVRRENGGGLPADAEHGWMMGRMLTGPVLPLLPAGAEEIAPGVGVLAGEDGGGLVVVHGLATFAWDPGDEAGRRLAAVQLVRLRAASQGQVAEGFGVDPAYAPGAGT